MNNIYTSTGNLVNTVPSGTLSSNGTLSGSGIFSQINDGTYNDPWTPLKEIEERLKKLETDNKFLRLKILSMEGKFTQEEVTNIRKMLISEDESSRTLAESIIENS